MTADEIRAALALNKDAIAKANADLLKASGLDEISEVDDRLVGLKKKRTLLQLEVTNLEAAQTVVAPLSAKKKAQPVLKQSRAGGSGNKP